MRERPRINFLRKIIYPKTGGQSTPIVFYASDLSFIIPFNGCFMQHSLRLTTILLFFASFLFHICSRKTNKYV